MRGELHTWAHHRAASCIGNAFRRGAQREALPNMPGGMPWAPLVVRSQVLVLVHRLLRSARVLAGLCAIVPAGTGQACDNSPSIQQQLAFCHTPRR
jgi:hypothetical protein